MAVHVDVARGEVFAVADLTVERLAELESHTGWFDDAGGTASSTAGAPSPLARVDGAQSDELVPGLAGATLLVPGGLPGRPVRATVLRGEGRSVTLNRQLDITPLLVHWRGSAGFSELVCGKEGSG